MKFSTQKECVFSVVMSVLTKSGIEFTNETIVKDVLTEDMKTKIKSTVIEMLLAKEAPLSKDMTDEEVKKYVPGLVSNHLRKDIRLNGGTKHKIQNPGVMTGNKDPKIKATRLLVKQLKNKGADEKTITKVEGVLEGLVKEWKAKNGKCEEIKRENLPPELIAMYEESIKTA